MALDAGKKISFSQTCSFLSQYMKGKGSLGELGLGLSLENYGFEAVAPTRTMNLLPMIEKSGENPDDSDPRKAAFPVSMFPHGAGVTNSESESGQMTIFYGGRVLVFDDLPAEKANEIMLFASKSSAAAQHYLLPTHSPLNAAQSPVESVNSFPGFLPVTLHSHSPQSLLVSDLPLARKNSLARFLEKRKERITAAEPYPSRKPADG